MKKFKRKKNEEVNVKIPLSDKNLGELINNENIINKISKLILLLKERELIIRK